MAPNNGNGLGGWGFGCRARACGYSAACLMCVWRCLSWPLPPWSLNTHRTHRLFKLNWPQQSQDHHEWNLWCPETMTQRFAPPLPRPWWPARQLPLLPDLLVVLEFLAGQTRCILSCPTSVWKRIDYWWLKTHGSKPLTQSKFQRFLSGKRVFLKSKFEIQEFHALWMEWGEVLDRWCGSPNEAMLLKQALDDKSFAHAAGEL